ncbi:MAG TPA: hypothetical protein VN375_14035 [Vicinamibacteria bacterium]|nr:hypothetical protein [Vicinamibacteria bacterium]
MRPRWHFVRMTAMLTKEICEGLKAERDSLLRKRREIVQDLDTRIKAIEALLSPSDGFGPRQQRLLLNDEATEGPLTGKGLREAMKIVLLSYPAGLKAADLTTKLEQLGYQSTGNLPVKARVWAEIGRLKKERRIQKRGRRVVWSGKETARDQAAALRQGDVPENGHLPS